MDLFGMFAVIVCKLPLRWGFKHKKLLKIEGARIRARVI